MSLREYRLGSLRDKLEFPTNKELEEKTEELKKEVKKLKKKGRKKLGKGKK